MCIEHVRMSTNEIEFEPTLISHIETVQSKAKQLAEESETTHTRHEIEKPAKELQTAVSDLRDASIEMMRTVSTTDGLSGDDIVANISEHVFSEDVSIDVKVLQTIIQEVDKMEDDLDTLFGYGPEPALYEYGMIGDEIWSKIRRVAAHVELTGAVVSGVETDDVTVSL